MPATLSTTALLVVALGVSADAFAVSVGKGLAMRRLDVVATLALATSFGLFQGLMPLLGWAIGTGLSGVLAEVVQDVDHWIAFGLLAAVGVRMLRGALSSEADAPSGRTGWREVLVLSVATSIDALAVGTGFAFLGVDVLRAALLIGATTLLLSALGVLVGHVAGARLRRPAEVLGGLVLIGTGVRILVDHLTG